MTAPTDTAGATVTVAAPAGEHLDTERWRKLPIGTILSTARMERRAPMAALRAAALGVPPRRPRGGSEAHRRRVAEVYRIAVEQGAPPANIIRDHWYPLNINTAQEWIKEARDHGLLGSFAEEKKRLGADHFGRVGEGVSVPLKATPREEIAKFNELQSPEARDVRIGRSRGKNSTRKDS